MATIAQLGPLVYGAPWMWLWGLAAALPVIIHLLNRRQFREETWAAMEYLLRAMRKNSRRIRIEQLLLLVVRAMILILAALAWMDLIWSSTLFAPTASGPGNTHTVLLIDGSYSMNAKSEDAARFERARQLAGEVVDAAARGDAFTLVLMGEPLRVVIGQPAFDPQDVKQELATLELPHAGADLAASLAAVEKLLADDAQKQNRIASQRVCIFSDLQRLTWGQLDADGSDGRIRRISQVASLTLFDVGQDGLENLAVTSLTQREPYVVAVRDVTFQAQIKNFGPGDRINYAVKLLVDDRPADEKRIDVAAGEEASIAFTHRFAEAGEHVVRVELPEDGLPTDNRRWLSVPVREALQVLVIGGQPGVGQHVALALSPRRRSDPLIRTEVASDSAIAERDLSQYDGVFLCNVARVSRDEAAVLHEYVKGGGGLIVFLGDQVVADDYNRQLGGQDNAPRLLPARIGEVSATSDYRFDPRKYEHPIVDVFRGHENTGLLTTPIKKYFKLLLPEKTEARVALWLDSGDPAIIEEQIGRGRVFLVATAASRHSLDRSMNPPTEWTIFSEFPSFPPIVHEMLAMAAGQRFENRNVLVGQPLGSSVTSTDVGITLDVKPPGRPAERVRLTLDGDRSVWSFTGTDQSGVYRAEFGEPISHTELFCANIDPRESDPSRISADELPTELSRKLEQVQSEVSSSALAGPRWYLFRWLLCGVLALLLLETFLAWHFGNRSL